MRAAKRHFNTFKAILILLYLCAAGLWLYFARDGLQYYLTPLMQRPHSEGYALLKPGGLRGHALGIAGGAMMVLLLLYSVRKRTRLFGDFGDIGRWLDIHIFLGVTGPMFVILHSSFKLNGIIAVGFWSMIIVMLSGIMGRYLYLQIPRNIQGHELSLDEIRSAQSQLTEELRTRFKLRDREIEHIEAAIQNSAKAPRSLPGALITFLAGDLMWLSRRGAVRRRLQAECRLNRTQMRQILRLAARKARLDRRIRFWSQMHRLFEYWHVFHKPFAYLMYLLMIVHIALSVWLGYHGFGG